MVLRVEPIQVALRAISKSKFLISNEKKRNAKILNRKSKVVLLSLGGKRFTQKIARRLALCDRLILICGHYEGVDERIKKLIDEEISVGPYVLSGGELPAMTIVDCVTRQIPGSLGKIESLEDSRGEELASYPTYTRPEQIKIKGKMVKVPKILLGGDHKKIEEWKRKKAISI